MTNPKRRGGAWLFAATSIISFIAALLPVLKGEAPNAVFLASGALFLIVAIAVARRARTGGDGPPAS